MVRTPWSEEEMPFEKAAEIGTRKVICDHSTIGVVVTSDGSFTGIPRSSYIEAEERVISELKECKKPFLIPIIVKINKLTIITMSIINPTVDNIEFLLYNNDIIIRKIICKLFLTFFELKDIKIVG